MLGTPDAPLTLTMVSGPFCGPCASAHQVVEQLLADHMEYLRVIIRFTANDENEHDPRNPMVRHMLALGSQQPSQLADALTVWYETRQLTQLAERFPVIIDEAANTRLRQQARWCRAVNIQFTPTFFINDRPLPKHFTVADLHYHVRHIAEQAIQPVAP